LFVRSRENLSLLFFSRDDLVREPSYVMVTSRVTLLAVLTLALIYVYVNRRTKALKLNKGNKQGEKEVVNTKNDKVYMVAAEVTECAPVKMDTVCVASANLATECAPVTARLRASVEKLLGREPRGLREVPVLDKHGEPAVVRVASLVGGKPFPTLFWLVDPDLCFRIDQAEASGLIKQFQKMVDADEGLRVSMKADHEAHIELRNQYMDAEERLRLQELGFYKVLQKKGIGGIANLSYIRCLHTWYGAHLVKANTIGKLLDAHWAASP
jgi:hypothetical protein